MPLSATLKLGPDLEVDEVDDGAAARARAAEEPVDQVAGGAAEQQARG